ncbi:MAG: carboxypeptidase regulatory-like domain-containing protein [Planctomycetota bacterium]
MPDLPDAPPSERKSDAKRPPPPGRVIITRDSEQQRYLESLERRARTGRRRGRWLAAGVAAVLLVSLIAGMRHYASSVLSHAELDPAIRVERNPRDPDRLTLFYRPLSRGRVGFRRADADRKTELLDQVQPNSGDAEQEFEWRWSGVKVGDELEVTYRDSWSLVTTALPIPEVPPVPPLGDATLLGEVVNAINNEALEGVEVKVLGTRLRTQTGPDGRFRLEEAPTGPVAIEVSALNFSTDQFERVLASGEETPVRVALSPGLKAGQIRLVLTWNNDPRDLDAHLQGPLPKGKQFHVHFHEKGDLKSREFVNLDVDDRDGNGPETITVLGVLPGKYQYFVHDYTNRDTGQGTALACSGAEVKLYQAGQTYRFQADNESVGTIWRVCDIEVTEIGAKVTRINRYESGQVKTTAAMFDVVFLLDVGPETADFHGKMKGNCVDMTEGLSRAGLDCHFGLVPFCDPDGDKPMNLVSMTGDLATFKDGAMAAPDPNGEELPASSVAALQRALGMDFRENVPVQFVLVTNTPCTQQDELAKVAGQIKQRDIKTIVFANEQEKDVYAPLLVEGGRFQPLGGGEVAEADADAGQAEADSETDALLKEWTFDAKKGNIAEGLAALGMYRRRTQANREQWITQYGGTVESEQGVEEGLAWLARHQAEDGSWSNQCLGFKTRAPLSRCEQDHACDGPGQTAEMAHTGLALLAFQAGGYSTSMNAGIRKTSPMVSIGWSTTSARTGTWSGH